MRKTGIVVMSLIAMAIYLGSCGGGSSVTQLTTLEGSVTDKPVSNAEVKVYSMKTGKMIGSDRADSNGNYEIDQLDLAQYDSDDQFYTIATGGEVDGTDISSFFKFKSILGSGSELQSAAADGTVNSTDIPDMVVSHVTTAKVALVEALETGISLDGSATQTFDTTQIQNITRRKKEQEQENLTMVVKIAAAIKAAVDDPGQALSRAPDLATKDISRIAKESVTVSNGVAQSVAMPQGLEDEADDQGYEDSILGDTTLMSSAAGETTTTTTSVSASTLTAGTWYGYHFDTWGDPRHMGKPNLMAVNFASSGGSCSAGQISITISEESEETNDQDITSCGTLTNNILKFNIETQYGDNSGTELLEVVGTVKTNFINGTYTMSIDGEEKAGGIFKMGLDDGTDYSGTYEFSGYHTVKYVSSTATTVQPTTAVARMALSSIGDTATIEGSFTIDSEEELEGQVTEENSTSADTMMGELFGPRVQAKLSAGSDSSETIFMVFLLNESNITGLYIVMPGDIDSPAGEPIEAGTLRIESVTKS